MAEKTFEKYIEKSTQENNFKQTEIGMIPKDWEVVSLGEVFEIRQGKQLSRKRKIDKFYIKCPFLRTSNVFWRRIILHNLDTMFVTRKELRRLKVKKGDVFVCEGGDVGRTAILEDDIEFDLIFQNHLHRLRPSSKDIIPKFFVFWMEKAIRIDKLYISSANVTTIPNLSSSRLKSFEIPLPPIEEQQKIVRVLDKIQQAIEVQDKIIEQAKNLKKSLRQRLFTEGVYGEEQKETELGLIPKSWEVVRLGEVFEFSRKPRNLKIGENDDVPFIPMELIPDSHKYARWQIKRYSEISSGTFVFKDDIIVAKITPSFENGKQAILTNLPLKFGYATTEVLAFHPKDDSIISDYIFEYLRLPKIRRDLTSKMEGTTGRKRVPRNALKNLLFPLPSPEEQKQIAHILSVVDRKIEIEQRKKQILKELFKTMLHKLMSGEIRLTGVEI